MAPRPDEGAVAQGARLRALVCAFACVLNHYAFEPQLEGQDETPVFMEASFIALHMEDGEYVRKLPDGWYSTIGYGEKMLQYLKDRVERKE